jgi:hypothetical protein
VASVRRLVPAILVALAVATAAAAAATGPATYHYSVVRASATVRLTYSGEPVQNRERTTGYANVASTSVRTKTRTRNGALSRTGGRIAVKLSIATVERAKISQRTSESSPYVEQDCAQSTKRSGSGGLVLTRLAGGRVQARWAFPQANAVACPGPSGVAKLFAKRMVRVFTIARFTQSRPTLTLSGSASYTRGAYKGTYRWSATVALKRLTD